MITYDYECTLCQIKKEVIIEKNDIVKCDCGQIMCRLPVVCNIHIKKYNKDNNFSSYISNNSCNTNTSSLEQFFLGIALAGNIVSGWFDPPSEPY